jgi:hypothetical protein
LGKRPDRRNGSGNNSNVSGGLHGVFENGILMIDG